MYRYSNKKHPCHDKLKIIMNFKGGYNNLLPFIEEGSSGITDNSMYMYVTEENKYFLLDFLKSELIYFLLKVTNYNFGSNHKNEFNIMNLITIPNNKNYHNFYNITQTEINFIKTC